MRFDDNFLLRFGMLNGTKDQATETRYKYGTEWLVMLKDNLTYTWDYNGGVWCLTRMFDEVVGVEKPKPKAAPRKQEIKAPQYYTGNRRVGD